MTAPAAQPRPVDRPPVEVLDRGSSRPARTATVTRPRQAAPTRPPRRRGPRGPEGVRPRRGHIPGLDGIRALAILGVLVFHYTPTLLPGGFIGVDVFFVVSGFLITTLLLRELATRGRLDLPQFWLRRARRLLPALAVVVVVSVSAARLVGGDLLVSIGRQALGAMTFTTNWLEIGAGASYFHSTSPLLFVNFWSLAVEEQFYLLWPLGLVVVLALTRTLRNRLTVALGLAVASAVAMAVLYTPGEDATRVYYGTDTHLFGLMLGVALAFAWAHPSRGGLTSAAWNRWRPVAVTGSLVTLLLLMRFLSEATAWTFRGGLLLACVATAVLIAGLLERDSVWRSAMQARSLGWLGQRSYGIYLWHWPVLVIALELFPVAHGTVTGWAVVGGALVVTLLVSEASHRVVETPVRRDGFRATLRRVGSWVSTPWEQTRVPRLVGGAVAALVVLTLVAVATAPDKSETQRRIEAAEAAMAGPGPATWAADASALAVGIGTAAGPAAGEEEEFGGTVLVDVAAEDDPEGAAREAAEGEAAEGEAAEGEAAEDAAEDAVEDDAATEDEAEGDEAEGDAEAAADPVVARAQEELGYELDDDGLLVPQGSDITAIGDSLVVTSRDGLTYRFPEIGYAAKSNRQWKDAMPVLEAALAAGEVRDNVVVHFGTNAGVDEDLLREFMDALGPERRVVVVNLYGSSTFVPGSNEAVERVVADYPNAVVGDWNAAATAQPETLQSDRVHPDLDGMHVYAEMVAEAFDELARRTVG